MLWVGIWRTTGGWILENLLEPMGIDLSEILWAAERVPKFFLALLVFYLLARGLVWVLSKTVLRPTRVDPMLGHLVRRLLLSMLMFVGFTVSLLVFDFNIFDLAIGLGLVGAGLALGLQNTVANVMGGISLVSDRPFEVGDRVQIGEFWGDVEQIGLRSTRILTARREYVVVPNRLMDEREIWNYTKRYPELRVDIDVEISYDSDVDLARELILGVAEEHPDVLSFPQPVVLNHEFQESGVRMQLRCFISDARQQFETSSDLRDQIKTALQDNGVEIPYPYRTLVEKPDLPAPATLEQSPEPRDPLSPRRVLVASAGKNPAIRKAETVVDICQDLDAEIVLTHIARRASIVTEREGERAADIYEAKAGPDGPRVRLVNEEGGVVDAIRRTVDQWNCGAVIIGSSPSPVLRAWKRAGIEDRVRRALDVPVIVVSDELTADRRHIENARRSLNAIERGEEQA